MRPKLWIDFLMIFKFFWTRKDKKKRKTHQLQTNWLLPILIQVLKHYVSTLFFYIGIIVLKSNVKALANWRLDCKGQLISECFFEKIVWTKIPTKNLIDSAHYTCWAESIKFFVGILVQTIFSKRHFEINRPLLTLIILHKLQAC